MRQFVEYTLLNAADTTGASAVLVKDFRHAIFSFATDGGGDAALTVKFQGAISPAATTGASAHVSPDFASAQSVTNMWDYIEVVDLEDGATIDGDTGISVATADDYRLVEMNINGLEYAAARVTARTEGEVTVKIKLFND